MVILPNGADRPARTILESVCTVLDQKFKVNCNFKAYVFGSVLVDGSGWADVDILIVVTDPQDCDCLSQALEPIAATFPLHVTFVLHSEFNELGAGAWGTLQELSVY